MVRQQIVFITIGEAPRKDLQDIYEFYFGNTTSIKQIGLLDGLSHTEAEMQLGITPGQNVETLTSCFIDGYQVLMSQVKVEAALQKKIDQLETNGISIIGLLCTGEFKYLSTKSAKLVTAEEIIIPYIKRKYKEGLVAIVTPLENQIDDAMEKWNLGERAVFKAASPYDFQENVFHKLAIQLSNLDVQAVVLDCIGYNRRMQKLIQNKLGKVHVYLSNELMFEHILEEYR